MDDETRVRKKLEHDKKRMFWLLLIFGGRQETKFYHCLTEEGRRRRQRCLPRPALCLPSESPWARLCESGLDQALITAADCDFAAFWKMLVLFKPWFDTHTPWVGKQDGANFAKLNPFKRGGGRPRSVDAKSCLGLVLAWCRFRGPEFILQGWFGFVGSHANVWLRFGRRGLIKLLWTDAAAGVRMPAPNKIEELEEATLQRHSLLDDVFCMADGLKLMFEQHADLDEQSMHHNGWTSGHHIANLFCFSVDGQIILATVNAPRSIHDSMLARWGGLCATLEKVYEETGGKCCVDSAFATLNAECMIKSAQNPTGNEDTVGICCLAQATSLRQAAEWGMRAIQLSFPRLKDKINIKHNGERRVFLHLMPLLCNFGLEHVGLNQIRNTHCLQWSVDAKHFVHR